MNSDFSELSGDFYVLPIFSRSVSFLRISVLARLALKSIFIFQFQLYFFLFVFEDVFIDGFVRIESRFYV